MQLVPRQAGPCPPEAMKNIAVTMALGAILTVLGGCGTQSAPTDCTNGCWQPTAADQQFVDAFCDLVAQCCPNDRFYQVDAGFVDDKTTCTKVLLYEGFSRDETLRSACLDEMANVQGAPDCMFDMGDVTSACSRVFNQMSGPVAPGGRCFFSSDCAGQPGALSTCGSIDNGPGGCFLVSIGSAGAACQGDIERTGSLGASFEFDPPWRRLPGYESVRCAASEGLGCAPTSFDDAGIANAGTCAPLLGPDAGCVSDGECAANLCWRGYCLVTQNPYPGYPCTSDNQCDSFTCTDGACSAKWTASARATLCAGAPVPNP
jgi:hypothetical protein